jgi:3-dehydroquinate synthase
VETVVVKLEERSYPIHIGSDLLSSARLIRESIDAEQILVVTNDVVAPLYLGRLEGALGASGESALILPDGEVHKSLATFERIIDELIRRSFHRDACVVALGGGVIGDVAGFAAASYQRGIGFVQVPTTLLAQVDSAVGGKTAVNHPSAKNMIGAFYQPSAVISDTSTLATLPPRELSAGVAEVIKYGLIVDAQFFAWLESNVELLLTLDSTALTYAIRRCCEIKAAIVAADEHESGRRALLNLGHTFGHAIEALTGYEQWLHGEAVALGTSIAARVSAALGMLSEGDCERIDRLLERARLPISASGPDPDALLAAIRLDKKAGREGLKVILMSDIGAANVVPAPDASLLRNVLAEKLEA